MRSRIAKLIFGFFLLVFLALPGAFSLLAVDFPTSLTLDESRREPTSLVSDYAGMLSSDFRQSLEVDLQDFEKETTAEIAVVAIDSLEGDSIEEVAVRLFEQWGIGKKEKDNGILILIAKEDRKMRIEVGYGLEPIITDGRAGRIIREKMRPAFKEEDYEKGVKSAVEQIKDYIRSGEPPAKAEAVQEKTAKGLPLIILATVILIYLSSFLARSKRFWPGGVIGGVIGGLLGLIVGAIVTFFLLAIGLALFGLILDYILSKNYKERKKARRSTGFFSSWGGFSSGGGGGGGFGGFGGGSSGGAGASGSW